MDIGWHVARAADLPDHGDWLTDHERAVLGALRFPKRRADWCLGRWAAKQVLGSVEYEIRAAEDGAPEAWREGSLVPRSLSISHAGGLGLAAVASSGPPIGCDVEVMDPRSERFVDDYFTVDEVAWVRAQPDHTLAANLIWSAKESVLKAMREGLRLDTRRVAVTVPPTTRVGWSELSASVDGVPGLWGWWRATDRVVLTVAGLARSTELLGLVRRP